MHRGRVTTTTNIHWATGKGEDVTPRQSDPTSKVASLRYFQTLFPSSAGHENFRSGIY